MRAAIRDPNPVVILEHEILYGQSFDVPEDPDFIVPLAPPRLSVPVMM
jgi:pyruvate dehydrogenase E1 component beta subunit